MINNDQIITLYKKFICVTIHHGWKAGKLYYDVKNEMDLNKIFFFFSFPTNPLGRSVSYVISEKKVKIDIFKILSHMVALLS